MPLYASQLLAYDAYQLEDPVDKDLERDFQSLVEIINEKSEVEISGTLLNQSSQSVQKHAHLINGLMFAILTQQQRLDADSGMKYLAVCARDNFAAAVSVLKYFTGAIYHQLQEHPRNQIIWLIGELVKRKVKSIDIIILNMMKNIQGGDTSPMNIQLIRGLLQLLETHKPWALQYHGLISTSCYTFLRTAVEHFSIPDLQRAETAYCRDMIINRFTECQVIGRDLVRALWEASIIPELGELYNQIINDSATGIIKGFTGVKQLLHSPTPKHFLQCRLTPEMEANLLFILEKVEWGKNDDTYLDWFGQLYLQQSAPAALNSTIQQPSPQQSQITDVLLSDIIRYIVAAFYPPNELIQSKIIPRFALLGKLCKKNAKSVNTPMKFALFFDWICFCGGDGRGKETVMNVEPGMLLMDRSVERYTAITQWCLEYLNQMVTTFHPPLSAFFRSNITEVIRVILSKGVLRSIDHLYHCQALDQASKTIIWDLFYQPPSRINTVHDKAPVSTEFAASSAVQQVTDSSEMEMEEVPEISVDYLAEIEAGEVISEEDDDDDEKVVGGAEETNEKELNGSQLLVPGGASMTIAMDQTIPEPAALDESLWMFGDLFTQLSQSLMEPDEVEDLLTKILEVCLRMSVPLDNVAAQLLYLLRAQPITEEDSNSKLMGWRVIFGCYQNNLAKESAQTSRSLLLELIQRDQDNLVGRRLLLFSARNNDFQIYSELLEKRSGDVDTLILADLTALEGESIELFFKVLVQLLAALPQYTVGKLPIIKAVVSSMDPQQLYRIVYEITAKRIRFIGNQISVSFIMATFDWDSFEQQNFWQIAISEALIQLSLRDSFCTALIDLFSNWQSKDYPEASLGILQLLKCDPIFAQSEGLLHALLARPADNDDKIAPFYIAVLNSWTCVPGIPKVLDKTIEKLSEIGDSIIQENLKSWKDQRINKTY